MALARGARDDRVEVRRVGRRQRAAERVREEVRGEAAGERGVGAQEGAQLLCGGARLVVGTNSATHNGTLLKNNCEKSGVRSKFPDNSRRPQVLR